MAIKHRIKKYLDDVLPSVKQRKEKIKAHTIGKGEMLEGLRGVIGDRTDIKPAHPVAVAGIDVPMAHPLPN